MDQEPFDEAQGFKLATDHEPSDQFMAANVVLGITCQLLFYFLAQVATKNRFLALLLFYGALNSLVYVILCALFRGVADTFVLRCGY